jgi:hypothetical protein
LSPARSVRRKSPRERSLPGLQLVEYFDAVLYCAVHYGTVHIRTVHTAHCSEMIIPMCTVDTIPVPMCQVFELRSSNHFFEITVLSLLTLNFRLFPLTTPSLFRSQQRNNKANQVRRAQRAPVLQWVGQPGERSTSPIKPSTFESNYDDGGWIRFVVQRA